MGERIMKPGPKLDALIAEKVMGYDKDDYMVGMPDNPRPYSTDIKAAWEVLEELEDITGCYYNIQIKNDPNYGLFCLLMDVNGENVGSFGDTTAHAICLAALKVVEGVIDD